MKMPPNAIVGRVSVIIITYNYARFIGQAIQSVLNQGVTDLEIIVVDDGSTDRTPEAVAPYLDRITYRRQENAGQSAARNRGLSMCTGEFIQFLDSDDLLGPNKLHTQLAWFRKHPASGVVVSPTRPFSGFTPRGKPVVNRRWHLFNDHLDLHLCCTNIAPPHAFLFRRNAVVRAAPFDGAVDNCEDYDMLLRATVHGHVPVYVPHCSVYYRKHDRSVTANTTRQYLVDADMHHRLAGLLAMHSAFPAGNRPAGLVAFCAGALQTAARLMASHRGRAGQLVNLAAAALVEATALVKTGPLKTSYPLTLYCLKTAVAISDPRLATTPGIFSVRQQVHALVRRLNVPAMAGATGTGFLRALIGSDSAKLREHLFLVRLAADLLARTIR